MNLNEALALITALLPILIPLGMFLYHLLLEHLPSAKRSFVEREVALFVRAAEQAYKDTPGSGPQKKAEVLQALKPLGLDPVHLNALIEAAVLALPPK